MSKVPSGPTRSSRLAAWLSCCLLWLVLCPVLAAAAVDKVVVADDRQYPPFIFFDASDAPRGILVDIWRLWSAKTGIPVEFRLTDWGEALAMVRDGRADALGGLTRTPERESVFEFTPALAEVPTAVFFHRQIAGIGDIGDLSGFRIGVVKGDSAEELLRAKHPELSFATYPGAGDLVAAAVAGEIKVFVSDTPVALYYLAQHPEGDQFRQMAGTLDVTPLHTAVRKGNTEMLAVVQRGFAQISSDEVDGILHAWSGRTLFSRAPWRPVAAGFATLGGIILCFLVWGLALRRRVAQRTAQLAESMQELRRSEEKYRLLVEHQTDLVVKVDPEGRFLYVSPGYCAVFGKSEGELLGVPFMPLVHDEDLPGTIEAMKTLHIPPYMAYVEQRAMTADGWRWFAWNDSAVLGEDGRVKEIIGVGRDITERREAEELLRQSRESFAKAFHSNPAPLIISELESGLFLDCNERWLELIGYSREEMLGRSSRDLGIWHDPSERDRIMGRLEDGGAIKDEPVEFVTSSGQIRSTLWSGEILTMAGRKVLLSMIFDITDRLRAEEALRQSEQLYRSVIDNIQDVYYRTDASGILTLTSPSGARLLGVPVGYALGRPVAEFWFDPGRREELLGLLQLHGQVDDFELTLRHSDGSPVQVATSSRLLRDEDGTVLGVEGIFRDIRARKRAEQDLRQSEEKFASLFKMSPDGIALTDCSDGRIVEANEACARLSGYSLDELQGRTTLELGLHVDPAARSGVFERMRRTGALDGVELELRRKDGTPFPCSFSCRPVQIGNHCYLLAVMRDMTEFKRMQSMMMQTEKMISLGGIAAGMAHEVNNPLAIIVQATHNMAQRVRPDFARNIEAAGALGLDMALLHRYMESRGILTFVSDIQSAAQRAASIIRNMLDFSNQGPLRHKACDIRGVAERALAQAARDFDLERCMAFDRIVVEKDFASDLPLVLCTETEIEQVLLNLFRNAAQAMGMAEPPVADPRLAVRLRSDIGLVRIEVEDNGPGMPEDVQRRVFEPFFTTKPTGIGTGLGLSVSYFIVTRGHGGRMWVASTPGQGTKFVVELPVTGVAGSEGIAAE